MKKFKGILTGTLLIMTLGMLTACGNNNNAADETGTVTEENDMMGDNADDNVNDDAANATANENNADANSGADDAALSLRSSFSMSLPASKTAGSCASNTTLLCAWLYILTLLYRV